MSCEDLFNDFLKSKDMCFRLKQEECGLSYTGETVYEMFDRKKWYTSPEMKEIVCNKTMLKTIKTHSKKSGVTLTFDKVVKTDNGGCEVIKDYVFIKTSKT